MMPASRRSARRRPGCRCPRTAERSSTARWPTTAPRGRLRKQLTAAGWKGTQIGGDGVNDKGFAQAAGNDAAAGSIVTCPCSPASKAGGSFVTDYKTKWNTDAGTYSDVAFDAANIFLKGIDGGNTTAAKMLEYVNGVKYEGVANT